MLFIWRPHGSGDRSSCSQPHPKGHKLLYKIIAIATTGPYKSPGYVRGMITSGIMIGALIKRCIHLKGLCHDGRMLVYIKQGGQTCQFVGNCLLVLLYFIQRNSWTNFCKNFSPIKNIYLSWFRCVYFPDWSFVLRVAVTAYISVLNLLWCCSPLHMVAVLHQRK